MAINQGSKQDNRPQGGEANQEEVEVGMQEVVADGTDYGY